MNYSLCRAYSYTDISGTEAQKQSSGARNILGPELAVHWACDDQVASLRLIQLRIAALQTRKATRSTIRVSRSYGVLGFGLGFIGFIGFVGFLGCLLCWATHLLRRSLPLLPFLHLGLCMCININVSINIGIDKYVYMLLCTSFVGLIDVCTYRYP